MTYNYYVSYIATNKKGQQGPGFATIQRQDPIKTGDDVLTLSKDIKKWEKYKAVTIMNWILLES